MKEDESAFLIDTSAAAQENDFPLSFFGTSLYLSIINKSAPKGRFRACSAPFVPLFCSRRPESRSPGQDGYELPDPAIAEFLRLSMVSEKLYGSGQKEGNKGQAPYI